MTPQERQLRILEFIERYQLDRRDAPTIREVVVGSGVSSYQDIREDIESLVARRLAVLVDEAVSGSEPFSSRQVRSTRTASAASAPTAAAPPPAHSRPEPQRATGARPASPMRRKPGRPMPPAARPTAGGAPPGWGAPADQTGPVPPSPVRTGPTQRAAPPPASPPQPAARRPIATPPRPPGPWPSGGQSPMARPTPAGGLEAWSLPARGAATGLLLAVVLILALRPLGGTLPARPSVSVAGRDIGVWALLLPGLWALCGLAAGWGIERAGIGWLGLGRGLALGVLGGLVHLAAQILGLDRLQGPLEAWAGPARFVMDALSVLPLALAMVFAPTPGAPTLAQLAGLATVLAPPGGPSLAPIAFLLAPLVALPAELAPRLGALDHRRRAALGGALVGLMLQMLGRAFIPAAYPSAGAAFGLGLLRAMVAGGAMAWAVAALGERIALWRGQLDGWRAGRGP